MRVYFAALAAQSGLVEAVSFEPSETIQAMSADLGQNRVDALQFGLILLGAAAHAGNEAAAEPAAAMRMEMLRVVGPLFEARRPACFE